MDLEATAEELVNDIIHDFLGDFEEVEKNKQLTGDPKH